MTRNLSGPGIIRSVVNGEGFQVDAINKGPSYIEEYSGGSIHGISTLSAFVDEAPVETTSTRESKGKPNPLMWVVPMLCLVVLLSTTVYICTQRRRAARGKLSDDGTENNDDTLSVDEKGHFGAGDLGMKKEVILT